MSRNLRTATRNSILNDRCRVDDAVQDDRHPFFDVFPSNPFKFLSALGVKGDRDIGFIELIDGHHRIAQHITRQHDTLFDDIGNAELDACVLVDHSFK